MIKSQFRRLSGPGAASHTRLCARVRISWTRTDRTRRRTLMIYQLTRVCRMKMNEFGYNRYDPPLGFQ